MIEVRPAAERGRASLGWLNSAHSFSFGQWYNPERMGVSDLRVLNDDRVAAGGGFPPHPHQDMEIISYVLDGALTHRDSMGNRHTVRPGEIQIMSAGSGITHSEMNASRTDGVHFLQIWIEPDARGTEPGYGQETLDVAALREGFSPIVGKDGLVDLRQDARVLAAWPLAGTTLDHVLDPGRVYYLHVASGRVTLLDGDTSVQALAEGDALVLESEQRLRLKANSDAQLLLFELRGGLH